MSLIDTTRILRSHRLLSALRRPLAQRDTTDLKYQLITSTARESPSMPHVYIGEHARRSTWNFGSYSVSLVATVHNKEGSEGSTLFWSPTKVQCASAGM